MFTTEIPNSKALDKLEDSNVPDVVVEVRLCEWWGK